MILLWTLGSFNIRRRLRHLMPRYWRGWILYPSQITCRTNGARLKISPRSISTSLVFIPVFSQHQGFSEQWQRPLPSSDWPECMVFSILDIDFNSNIQAYWVSCTILFLLFLKWWLMPLFFVSTPYEIAIGGFWFHSRIYYLKWEHALHACQSPAIVFCFSRTILLTLAGFRYRGPIFR